MELVKQESSKESHVREREKVQRNRELEHQVCVHVHVVGAMLSWWFIINFVQVIEKRRQAVRNLEVDAAELEKRRWGCCSIVVVVGVVQVSNH